MTTCPNCSTLNPKATQTCISCGAPLVEAAERPNSDTILPEENEIPEPSPYAEQGLPQTRPDGDLEAPIPISEPVEPIQFDFIPPKKDRSLAIILEVVPGLFGFLGIGWIYSGFTGAGIAWLAGFLVWNIVALVICIVTAGLGCLCTLPVNLVVLIASVIALNSHIQNHNEQFNP